MAVRRGYIQSSIHVRRRVDSRLDTLRTRQRGPGSEWLKTEYVDRQRDCVQIGAELGKDPKTIWTWLKHYGIATRARGENPAVQFKKGSQARFGIAHSAATKEKLRQARLRDGHVPYLKDGKPYWQGRTGAHHVSWKGGVTPERQAFYASAAWIAVRPQVYGRADNRCERCGAGRPAALHIHHIVSFAVRESRALLSNLALLCRACHLFVHSKQNAGEEFIG